MDTVLLFLHHHALRVLTSVKHRFGRPRRSASSRCADHGLAAPRPGSAHVGDRMAGVPGSVVVPLQAGDRSWSRCRPCWGPAPAVRAWPRGRTRWASTNRPGEPSPWPALSRARGGRAGAPAEFFVAAVGGITVSEPAADLAVALAMASVVGQHPVPADLVVFGELGLAGGAQCPRRRPPAGRGPPRGFTRALVPASALGDATATAAAAPAGAVHGVRTLAEALELAGTKGGPQVGYDAGVVDGAGAAANRGTARVGAIAARDAEGLDRIPRRDTGP